MTPPLVSKDFAEPTPTEVLIGKNCAELVPDGACIQMGIGALPNALAAQLADHKNLGVHTEMFADGILRLIKKGVVNGANKKIDKGKIVASFPSGLSGGIFIHRPQSGCADEGHQVRQRSVGDLPEPEYDGHQFSHRGGPDRPDLRRLDRNEDILRNRRPAGFCEAARLCPRAECR